MYLVAAFLVAGLQLWFSGVLILMRRTDALLGCNIAAGLLWIWYAIRSYKSGNLIQMALGFIGLLGSVALGVLGLAEILF